MVKATIIRECRGKVFVKGNIRADSKLLGRRDPDQVTTLVNWKANIDPADDTLDHVVIFEDATSSILAVVCLGNNRTPPDADPTDTRFGIVVPHEWDGRPGRKAPRTGTTLQIKAACCSTVSKKGRPTRACVINLKATWRAVCHRRSGVPF